MTIGVLYLEILVPGARSLKDKRGVLKSLKARMHDRFNCSVAETGHQDTWGRSQITVCVVSGESRHANTQLNEIVNFVSLRHDAQLADYRIEML